MKKLFLALLAAGLSITPVAAHDHERGDHHHGDHDDRPLRDSEVVASVPLPGYPEGIATRDDTIYVSGPATFGLNSVPMVWAYDRRNHNLEKQFPVTLSNPNAGMRGLSCIAFGPQGKLYAIEPFVGIIRMDLDWKNKQEIYATFPAPGPNGSLLNDLVFDDDGTLYVTDSFAGIIYRVPKGGGAAQVWFKDARLLGNPQLPFGANGIRINKKNTRIYFTVTAGANFEGTVYSLPLVASPRASDLATFHVYSPAMGVPAPDGIAFGKSGNLYVTLAGASQISVLASNGNEIARLSGPAKIPGSHNTLPWANPANIAFDDKEGTLLVTNHASLVPYDPNLFAIFDVVVNDKALELEYSH